ncbi:MAG TPA: hypothetical protein VMW42_05285, partial [Desulfatiglandales bacterium]|nr:hypothetical protein [Desulfatiglandales bacterium]
LESMNKGFTIKEIRESFKVLRRFNFIYHCYYIIGNIGETRDEMLDIIRFSHELGVDTIALSLLRVAKNSPLIDMIKQLDHYHIEEELGKKVYSDTLSIKELQQIKRDINASFFTTAVILRILKKLIIHRFLTLKPLYRILIYISRRKISRFAKKRSIRMGKVYRF